MRVVSCTLGIVLFLTVFGSDLPAASYMLNITYPSSVSTDAQGPLHLKAELNYRDKRCPIAVVMHGYSPATGNFTDVRNNAWRLRDAGFFAISVALRGREGSDGVRNSGGVEIYDIYDAVEYVKTTAPYSQYVDGNNVHITGYSGGGGNVMSALTKFPDYFRAGSSYFGISDYGNNRTSGWYFLGAAASHQQQLRTDIGDPTIENALVLDRYAARASNLASRNNPYSEIHLFVNYNETTCPPVNHNTYRDNAVAAAAFAGEFNNISVHVGGYGQYVDFNGNGVNEASELQNWPHGFPTADQQNAAEQWYRNRLLSGAMPQPVLNDSDELYVAGYLKTKKFSIWLGDGQNAAANLKYTLLPYAKKFETAILTSDKTVKGKLSFGTGMLCGRLVSVRINGEEIDCLTAPSSYTYNSLGDGNVLEMALAGDVAVDGRVDFHDFAIVSASDSADGISAMEEICRNWLSSF